MKTLMILITLLIVHLSSSFAQVEDINVKTLKDWQLIGYAESAIRFDDPYSASIFYEEYYKRNKTDNKIALVFADICFEIRKYALAKDIYINLYKQNKDKYYTVLLNYSEILMAEKDYESAALYLRRYISAVRKNMKGQREKVELYFAKNKLDGCEMARVSPIKNDELTINHPDSSINKAHLETAPFILNDTTIVYSSLSGSCETNSEKKHICGSNKFFSAKLINNKWQGGFDAPKPFYSFDSLNTANGVYSSDHARFYFTSGKKNRQNKFISHIYVSEYINGDWSKPQELDSRINLKNYTSTQPTIGKCYIPKYEIIYFVSDRPHGKGGKDIWFTVYDTKERKYKKPINAGGYINTIADEITPYYDNENKILYFSTNGLPGFGGYDIFKTNGWGASWEEAINVGLPINSGYDDMYFSQNKTNDFGFVVSNREGSVELYSPNCCYDLFEFSNLKQDTSNWQQTLANSNDSVTDIDYISMNQLEINQDNNITTSLDFENYLQEEIKNKNTNINTNSANENTKKASISFNNIYFDYNSAELKTESKEMMDTTIVTLLKKYQNIMIEIGAHTDGMGDKNYNQKLSEKRANSVVQYLSDNGIENSRMVATGYGENFPLAKEADKFGNDLPKNRLKNRRIEFKVIGVLDFN